MPKSGSITPKKLIRFLITKGFEIDHVTGSHYVLRHPISKRRVVIAHHTRTLPKGTLHDILKSADVSIEEVK